MLEEVQQLVVLEEVQQLVVLGEEVQQLLLRPLLVSRISTHQGVVFYPILILQLLGRKFFLPSQIFSKALVV